MDNLHLFELINAPAAVHPTRLLAAMVVAQHGIWALPLGWAALWLAGRRALRIELLQVAAAAACALLLAEALRFEWPHPRPAALGLGTQYLQAALDSGLPSDPATAVWAVALATLGTPRLSVWCFPLLTFGLVLGLSQVYIGLNFPFDVLAALPVAALGALVARPLQKALAPAFTRLVTAWDRWAGKWRKRPGSDAA